MNATPPCRRRALLATTLALLCSQACSPARVANGFDLANATIPVAEILRGGPPRDGIPSIDNPQFVAAHEVDYLRDDDIVIGIERDGVARAYPLRILIWHEIVNDVIGGRPVAVTYCPLCGSAMVFDAMAGGERRSFGVSGLLYNSDVLMYDRESESLWSQLAMKAVSGPAVGSTLEWLPSEHMTWAAWKARHPGGQVLSTDTGHRRDYRRNGYGAYFASGETMFPVPTTRRELPAKDWVLGVIVAGQPKAYPVAELPANQVVNDTLGGRPLAVEWNPEARRPTVRDGDGARIPALLVYWFAWQAFHPATELWSGGGDSQPRDGAPARAQSR